MRPFWWIFYYLKAKSRKICLWCKFCFGVMACHKCAVSLEHICASWWYLITDLLIIITSIHWCAWYIIVTSSWRLMCCTSSWHHFSDVGLYCALSWHHITYVHGASPWHHFTDTGHHLDILSPICCASSWHHVTYVHHPDISSLMSDVRCASSWHLMIPVAHQLGHCMWQHWQQTVCACSSLHFFFTENLVSCYIVQSVTGDGLQCLWPWMLS
jgi:hypothetical protein